MCEGDGDEREENSKFWKLINGWLLCFDLLTRPRMPFKVMHRKQLTHSNGSYERKSRGRKLVDEMGWDKKIPRYSHRLTHRKRVTSVLHDSYFRLMTIKHPILKIAWAIKWALNYYIAQSRQKSSSWVAASWRRDVVGKATPGRRDTREIWWIGVRRTRKTQRGGHKVGGQNIAVMFDLHLPLTVKPHTTFSNPWNKVRGKYFYKEVFLRLYPCVCLFIVS